MKRKITICMGSSCFARGNEENLRIIETFLETNNLKADVELSGARCTQECAKGPNIIIDGVIYNRMEKEALIDLLNVKFEQNGKGTK